MKKSITALSLFALLTSMSSFASANTFEIDEDNEEISQKCKQLEINDDVLSCKGAKNFAAVTKAKVGAKYSGTALEVINENDLDVIFELGIMPDADTNGIYTFVRELVDTKTKKQVGYIIYEGFENYEMGVKLQVVKRFNLAAQVVSVTVESK